MKKVINYFMHEATDEALAIIKNAGFDGLDLGFKIMNEQECRNFSEEAKKFREKLEKHGLECCQVHLPFHDMFLSSEICDEKMDKNIIAVLEAMNTLGAKWGAYHPRSSKNTGYNKKQEMEDNFKEISKYLEVADKHNVGIAVENIPIFPDCPQYRFFCADYEDHIELVDRFKSENVGICLDVGHLNLTLYDMEKVIEKMGERIKILHLHNNFRTGDMHITPAEGTINWDKVMPALKKAGYKGDVSLEINFGANFALKETLPSLMSHLADSAGALINRFNR
jgi:sugar phosphate isomerase/epimerase